MMVLRFTIRMPVILKPEFHERWLDPDAKDLHGILQDGMIREVRYHPVSTMVNNAGNNDPSLIEPIDP